MEQARHNRCVFLVALALFIALPFARAQAAGEPLRDRIVAFAKTLLGTPYIYGAESREAFDCSGFVRWVYRRAADMELPRNSGRQAGLGLPRSAREARPGDLLVFDTAGAGAPSHVGLYLGGGEMIHAVSEGPRTGVLVSPMTDSYFAPRLLGVRDLLGVAAAIAAPTVTVPTAPTAPSPAAPAPATAVPATAVPATAVPATAVPATAVPAVTSPADIVSQIGFTVTGTPSSVTDPVPTQSGTSLAFTLRNGTGKDARFHVVFYRLDAKGGSPVLIHDERVSLRPSAATELPPFAFVEPGRYTLVVKDSWNTQLLERRFIVRELGG